ncbi:MAG: STAS/SEC14 domain-containing protein [Solirubrobacteraceae bacterium]
MVHKIQDMPPGTVGLRVTGELTREDYRGVIEPALRDAVASGEVRLMLVAAEGFDTMTAGARIEDAKTNLSLGLGHLSAWKRSAIVSDSEWVRNAFTLLGWLTPVEIRVWRSDEESQAKAWVSAD